VASLLVQTHVSYAYNVILFTIVAVAIWWWRERPVGRADISRGVRSRTAMWSAIVVAVLWAQSLWEQFFGPGRGNLTRLIANSSGGDVDVGMKQGLQVMSSVLAFAPWWLRSGFSTAVPSTRLTDTPTGQELRIPGLPSLALSFLAVAAIIASLAWFAIRAGRTGRRSLSAACAFTAATIPLSIVCLSLVTIGQVGFALHHIRWLWTYVVLVHAAVLWGLVELVVLPRLPTFRRALTPAVAVLLVAFAIINLPFHAHRQGSVSDYDKMPALRRAFREIDVLRGHDPVLFDVSNVRVFEPYSSAVMMRMQHLGIEFRVDEPGMIRQLGPRRRADGTEPTTVFQLEGVEALMYSGPACPVAITSARTPQEEAAASAIAETLTTGLLSGALAVDTITIDATTEVGGLANLEAARAGDATAARRIVLDGTMQRWADAGLVSVPAPADPALEDALASGFPALGAWTTTSYGLFAIGLHECP
jgi:hypothetical protein